MLIKIKSTTITKILQSAEITCVIYTFLDSHLFTHTHSDASRGYAATVVFVNLV